MSISSIEYGENVGRAVIRIGVLMSGKWTISWRTLIKYLRESKSFQQVCDTHEKYKILRRSQWMIYSWRWLGPYREFSAPRFIFNFKFLYFLTRFKLIISFHHTRPTTISTTSQLLIYKPVNSCSLNAGTIITAF